MKKIYQLKIEGKNRDRLLDAAKHDIRKYFKRERAKALPKDANFWDFDCKAGESVTVATEVAENGLMKAIDAVVQGGGDQFYVEVLARPAQRAPRSSGQPKRQGDPDHGIDD